MCEITPLFIRAGNNDSMKLLVFKFSKNEKGEKKKGDEAGNFVGGYRIDAGHPSWDMDFEAFKQNTEEDDG